MRRVARIPVLLLTLGACDRAAPEPAPVEARAPAARPPASGPAVKPDGPTLTPPLPSAAMVEQLLGQLVLDHPRVQPYLHSEVAGNVPLRLAASPELAQGAAGLQAGGQKVQVVGADAARFVFTGREELGAARERVKFEIPPEGVVGHVDLQLADNVWTAVDAAVAER